MRPPLADPFCYASLDALSRINEYRVGGKNDGMYQALTNEDFYLLQRIDMRRVPFQTWKFHLSVDARDVAKAWDVALPTLRKHGVGAAKIASPETASSFMEPEKTQAGKMLTLYASAKDGINWSACINELEHSLAAAGIRPGPAVANDRKIPGSRYSYYRNGTNLAGYYVCPEQYQHLPESKRYNVGGVPDPFFNLQVHHPVSLYLPPPETMKDVLPNMTAVARVSMLRMH
jgi:hypothetical protein